MTHVAFYESQSLLKILGEVRSRSSTLCFCVLSGTPKDFGGSTLSGYLITLGCRRDFISAFSESQEFRVSTGILHISHNSVPYIYQMRITSRPSSS